MEMFGYVTLCKLCDWRKRLLCEIHPAEDLSRKLGIRRRKGLQYALTGLNLKYVGNRAVNIIFK